MPSSISLTRLTPYIACAADEVSELSGASRLKPPISAVLVAIGCGAPMRGGNVWKGTKGMSAYGNEVPQLQGWTPFPGCQIPGKVCCYWDHPRHAGRRAAIGNSYLTAQTPSSTSLAKCSTCRQIAKLAPVTHVGGDLTRLDRRHDRGNWNGIKWQCPIYRCLIVGLSGTQKLLVLRHTYTRGVKYWRRCWSQWFRKKRTLYWFWNPRGREKSIVQVHTLASNLLGGRREIQPSTWWQSTGSLSIR